jgi:hypothetical protein
MNLGCFKNRMMMKIKLGKSAVMALLLCSVLRLQARPAYFGNTVWQDSSVQTLVSNRSRLLISIPAKQDINLYYISLMEGLYDGANELLDFEKAKGNNIGVMRQAGIFRQFNTERKKYLQTFLNGGDQKPVFNRNFRVASKAALSNFGKIDFYKYRTNNEITVGMLIEYYENMDQISVAFVSFSQNEKLKALSWDIIRKQNKIIDLLKAQQ